MRSAVPIVFLLLSFWFASGAGRPKVPLASRQPLTPGALSTAPLRTPLADPPAVAVGGVLQKCSDCHALFSTPEELAHLPRQHAHIVMRHGLNDRCTNCHSRQDRNKLALQGNQEVGYDEVVRLCAKCHGPTWRDWELGIHGRTQGSWQAEHAARRRLSCSECHDPHAPAFPALAPLPGPRTLRMGSVESPAEHTLNVGPLERWREAERLQPTHNSQPSEENP